MINTLYFVYMAWAAPAPRAGTPASRLGTSASRLGTPASRLGTSASRPGASISLVVGVSHHPLLDLAILSQAGYDRLRTLKGPLPLALAEREAAREAARLGAPLVGARKADGWTRPGLGLGSRSAWARLRARLRARDSVTLEDCASVVLPADEEVDAVFQALRGRALYEHEIRRALAERGRHVACPLDDVLQLLVLRGLAGRAPSVSIDGFGIARCERCGSREIAEVPCTSCRSDQCLHCTECASMGQARSCKALYYAPLHSAAPQRAQACYPPGAQARDASGLGGDEAVARASVARAPTPEPVLPFELTKAQHDAARALAKFVEADERRECLVFAVCGAGKTEVSFGALACALRRGGRALFAVPRSDVVAEVAPRVSSAFPDARTLALRGQVRERYGDADIVVATTHQVMRFYQAFDLVILDEADAFPYRGSRMLRFALGRAAAPGGKTVYMTATPDLAMLERAEQGRIALVRISARHHGYPLPEPVMLRSRLPSPALTLAQTLAASWPGHRPVEGSVPRDVVAVVEESIRMGRRVFAFVPTVELAGRLEAMLSRVLPARVASVHSRHPDREALRERFRAGQIDVLVTTTLMERGITVPNVDVVVLYADFEAVFDTGALIQMAGRAGRSSEYPFARVCFIAERVTRSMSAAVHAIREMNCHAAQSGYLRSACPQPAPASHLAPSRTSVARGFQKPPSTDAR